MPTRRNVFYSFHYKPDCTRAAKVRNIGVIEGNRPATDNDWETISSAGDSAIKRWISNQMDNKSCTIVLVGQNTANRKWINHEIVESWNRKMGIVGIRIHGITNLEGYISNLGNNPFDHISFDSGRNLSSIVKCYNPPGNNSKERYTWISENLSAMVVEAINIRSKN